MVSRLIGLARFWGAVQPGPAEAPVAQEEHLA